MASYFFEELKRRNVLRVGAAYAVIAWLVIQVAETIFPLFGFDETPARIVVILFSIGFIPALVIAWVFELTPEGLKREKDVDRKQSITPQTGKKLDRIIMMVLVLALGYFAFDKFILEPQREEASETQKASELAAARQEGRTEALVESYGDKSIAVLPFVNMSADQQQDYFSDGISEELLNLLARIPELRVISRSSAFSFRGRNLETPEIAKRLNVAHILEGSVRKSGNRVRITAQLIEARSDTHLWSDSYDRTLDDIFAIQDEIAATVVRQLKITLLGEAPRAQQTDPEAYSLYLQARHLSRQFTADSLERSNTLYQKALVIDPDYAAAWAGLIMNYNNQANTGQRPADEGFTLAREAAEKALAIDPDYALAHSRLGFTLMVHKSDLVAAARHMERALEVDPTNPAVIGNAAVLLSILGRQEQAIGLNEVVVELDPVNQVGYTNLGLNYILAGRWGDAIEAFETAIRLSPASILAHFYIGEALMFSGDAKAALAHMDQEELEVMRLLGLSLANHALGQTDAANAALGELVEDHERDAPAYIAAAYSFNGEDDLAFQWLEKAVEYDDQTLYYVSVDPLFGGIHDDPRWLPFLESIGRSPAQLNAIEFEVTPPQ